MKKPSSKGNSLSVRAAGALLLLLLALSVWFGLHPYYRFTSVGFLLLLVAVLIRPQWAFWCVLLALVGYGAFLLTFRASGYHYTALLLLGAAVLLLAFRFGKRWFKRLTALAAGLVLSLLLIAEVPILKAALSSKKSDAPYVIVLGAAVYGETPSISLRHRSDRALAHLKANPGAVAVVSGGQGEGEDISEAECMRRYLADRGVQGSRILPEDRSTSTLENLTFSKATIEAAGGDASRVAIVSSSYHLYRAERMAAALGMVADGLPSSDSYAVYMTGMYLREALAVWKLWLMGT